MKKQMAVFLAMAMFAALLAGCSSNSSSCSGSCLELVVYGSSQEDYLIAACENFEKLYGIKTSCQRLSTGEVYTKIKEENGKPSADVWFGGTTDPYNQAKNDGLLVAYTPENAKNLRKAVYKDPDGYWHGIYSGYLGFICNKDELDRLELPVPQDWEDLLDPRYKGMIAFANPRTSGTGKQLINTISMIYNKDEDKTMEFFKALDANIAYYPKSGSGPSEMVGSGEILIAIGFLHDGIAQIVAGNNNLILIGPTSGTSYEIGATAIFKGAKNIEAAELFVNYALSPDCQELAKKYSSYQFLTVTNANDPEEAAMVSNTQLIDYDFAWAAENASRLVELWFETIVSDGRFEE